MADSTAGGAARGRILVVDDETSVRFGIGSFLRSQGFEVEEADSCASAEERFSVSLPDAVVLDYRLQDGNALDLLPRFKAVAPHVPLIILTAYGSIELAVRAIKEGAEQFLTKPVELPALRVMLERLLETRRLRQKQLVAHRGRPVSKPADPFLGTSAAVRRLEDEACRVLVSDSPVLILGETGSGKGVLAAWLHRNGPRAEEAFVDINCAGLTRELLESELFGHEKGAFTGATARKLGLLDVAHRGTLFLDEIGDMEPAVQAKVLKVIEEKHFRRVGDVRDRTVDVHLIAASHRDLERRVADGKFRRDLYYRISVLPVRVPSLRERPEDVPLLAARLLEDLGAEIGRPRLRLEADAAPVLRSYPWPGNVRELRNALERAVLHAAGDSIAAGDLDFLERPAAPPDAGDAHLTLEELERRHIARVLAEENGRVETASRRLGIPRSTLYEKIRRLGISRDSSD